MRKESKKQPAGPAVKQWSPEASTTLTQAQTMSQEATLTLTPLTELQRRLVVEHARFAANMSHRYREVGAMKGIPREDLEQEAYLGLCVAAQRYDPQRQGVRFTTYAYAWVKKFILQAVNGQPFMLSADDEQLGTLCCGMSPTTDDDEPAAAICPPYDEPAFSADDDDEPAAADGQPTELIARLLGCLSQKERSVVCLLFGLTPDGRPAQEMSFRQVALELNLSSARVHQLYEQALTKMELASC